MGGARPALSVDIAAGWAPQTEQTDSPDSSDSPQASPPTAAASLPPPVPTPASTPRCAGARVQSLHSINPQTLCWCPRCSLTTRPRCLRHHRLHAQQHRRLARPVPPTSDLRVAVGRAKAVCCWRSLLSTHCASQFIMVCAPCPRAMSAPCAQRPPPMPCLAHRCFLPVPSPVQR